MATRARSFSEGGVRSSPPDLEAFEVESGHTPLSPTVSENAARDHINRVTRRSLLAVQAGIEVIQHPFIAKPSPLATVHDATSFHSVASSFEFDPYAMEQETTAASDISLGQVSVLTLNVWVNRAETNVCAQIEGIRKYSPDIICLQEVFSVPVLKAYQKAFPEYEFVAFGRGFTCLGTLAFTALLLIPATVFALMASALLYLVSTIETVWLPLLAWPPCLLMHMHFFRKHYFWPFLVGNLTGLALMVRKDETRLSKLTAKCTKFSYPLGHAEDFLNSLRPRGLLTVSGQIQLRGREETFPIHIATTHLNQPPAQSPGAGRHQQVKEICESFLKPGDGGLILLGADLNASPPGTDSGTQCSTYEEITRHLSDAWCATNPSDPNADGLTWDQKENPMCQSAMNSLFYGTRPLRWRCDYLLWGHRPTACAKDVKVSVKSCDMVFVGDAAVSDHYGVLAVLDISEAGSSSEPSSPLRSTTDEIASL